MNIAESVSCYQNDEIRSATNGNYELGHVQFQQQITQKSCGRLRSIIIGIQHSILHSAPQNSVSSI